MPKKRKQNDNKYYQYLAEFYNIFNQKISNDMNSKDIWDHYALGNTKDFVYIIKSTNKIDNKIDNENI